MRYIYEITNIISGKTYYGQRTLSEKMIKEYVTPLNDSYFGSGKILNLAIKKYGKENFKKSIIIYGNFSRIEIDLFEKCIIRIMRINGKAEYNIADGGNGGWFWGNPNKDFIDSVKSKLSKKQIENWEKINYRENLIKKLRENWGNNEYREKQSLSRKLAYKEGRICEKGEKNPMFGKTHSIKTRSKMSEKKEGEKNNRFGFHWYNNGIENISALECPEGFYEGRFFPMSEKRKLKKERIEKEKKEREILIEKRIQDILSIEKKRGWKTEIAKKWGVSHVTVVGFCKEYNLFQRNINGDVMAS